MSIGTPVDPDSSLESLPMRVGLGQFMDPTPELLRYIKQIGVNDVQLNMYGYEADRSGTDTLPLSGEREWSRAELVELRERIEDAGLRLNAIENVPIGFYDEIMLDGDGKATQLEHMKNTIRNLGRAGIPMFGYHWMPDGVQRTPPRSVRGGATVTAFTRSEFDDGVTHGRTFTESELWDNYEEFLREVLPVAEEVGVKLCLHPNDPPVESIGGIPQLFRNFENFKRAMNLVPSDNHGLNLCLGCWSEMGEELEEVIRYFGEREEIFYVHFRDVNGTVPSFHETFIDDGNYDECRVLKLLSNVGFSGMLLPDHVPRIEGDTAWGHRGRAHAVGYLQGLLTRIDCDC